MGRQTVSCSGQSIGVLYQRSSGRRTASCSSTNASNTVVYKYCGLLGWYRRFDRNCLHQPGQGADGTEALWRAATHRPVAANGRKTANRCLRNVGTHQATRCLVVLVTWTILSQGQNANVTSCEGEPREFPGLYRASRVERTSQQSVYLPRLEPHTSGIRYTVVTTWKCCHKSHVQQQSDFHDAQYYQS